MSEKTLNTRIINKHDIEANWVKATGFIPKQGEIIVYDVDSTHTYERIKIGDGTTVVGSLPFVNDEIRQALTSGAIKVFKAETADKAIQDGNGKVIADTYETKENVESKIEEALLNSQADLSQTDETAPDYVKGMIRKESLPDGYPYSGMTELFSVTDGAVTDDGYPVTQPLGLVVGDTYEVNWNGTLYSCVAEGMNMDGLVFAGLGDTAILGGGDPTGKYPFVMIEMPEGMSEGGVYAAVMPLDGSATVSFTIFGGGNIPIDKKWLPEGYPYIIEGGTTVLEETTLVEENGAFLLPVTLNKNATYKVTWNGTPYIVSPMEFANGLGTGVGWGDLSVMGEDATGEPFLIACVDSVGWIVFANDGSTTPTVEIVTEKSYVPMSEKYLSTGGLRLVNGQNRGSMRSADSKEEDDTYKVGNYSFVVGDDAQADGSHSVALGHGANATGEESVAFGRGCVARFSDQYVFGKYNLYDDNQFKYPYIFGGGGSDSSRVNLFTIDTSGSGWFRKGLKVGGDESTHSGARSVLLSGDTAPNPNALTFTGAVEGTYDGSSALTIDIPVVDESVSASISKLNTLVGDKSVSDQINEALLNSQADWDQTDSTKPDYIKNKPDENDAIELMMEMNLIEPVVAEDGSVYTDENGAMYTII